MSAHVIETRIPGLHVPANNRDEGTLDSTDIRESVHNFRNLISTVSLLSQLQIEELSTASAVRDTFQSIVEACNDADCLCNQMLNSGRPELVREQTSLPNVIRELAPLFSTYLPQGGELELSLNKCLTIHADGRQLRQLVLNVIKNACEAMSSTRAQLIIKTGTIDSDDIRMSEGVIAGRSQKGPYSFLEVSDTGCGMSELALRNLFHKAVSTKKCGHGLGMSSVLRCVLHHDGMIHVTSRERCGTTVRVLFPAIPKVLNEFEVRRPPGVFAPLRVEKCRPMLEIYSCQEKLVSGLRG